MYWTMSCLFWAASSTLCSFCPPSSNDLYASKSPSTVCFLCSLRTLSTALMRFSAWSVIVPALTAPSHGIGRARILFWRELRYVGGSRDMLARSTRDLTKQNCRRRARWWRWACGVAANDCLSWSWSVGGASSFELGTASSCSSSDHRPGLGDYHYEPGLPYFIYCMYNVVITRCHMGESLLMFDLV
jgi:hypothetical protein